MYRQHAHTCILLLFCLSSFFLRSQSTKVITESASFRLTENSSGAFNSGKYSLYQLSNGSDKLIQVFERNYYFHKTAMPFLFIASRRDGNRIMHYNLFDIRKGGFLRSWADDHISALSGDLFRASQELPDNKQEWFVLDESGSVLLQKTGSRSETPLFDSLTKLIWFTGTRDSCTFFNKDGTVYRRFMGYSDAIIVNGRILLANSQNEYGLLDPEGNTIIPFDNRLLCYYKGRYFRIKTGTYRVEVFDNETLQNCVFAADGINFFLQQYKDLADDSIKSWLAIVGEKKTVYYDTSFAPLLSLKNKKHHDGYLLTHALGDIFFLQGKGSDEAMLIKKTKVLAGGKKHIELLNILPGKEGYRHEMIAIDTWTSYGSELTLFNKVGKKIQHKELYESAGTNILQLDPGKGSILAFKDEAQLIFIDGTENLSPFKTEQPVLKKKNIQAFSFEENGKKGIACYDFEEGNTPGYGLWFKTPAFFDQIEKVQAMELSAYICGMVDGKKCLVFADPRHFRHLFVDEFPDTKTLFFANPEKPFPVRVGNKTIYIDDQLNTIGQQTLPLNKDQY